MGRLLVAAILLWGFSRVAPLLPGLVESQLICPPVPAPPLDGLPLHRVPAVRRTYESVVKTFYALGAVAGFGLGFQLATVVSWLGHQLLDSARDASRSFRSQTSRLVAALISRLDRRPPP
jgi:hypothetical protein